MAKRGRKSGMTHLPGGKASKRKGAGSRGPRPEPTESIKRRGGRPRKDRGRDPEKEPKPEKYTRTPPPPAMLSKHPYAVACWKQLAPHLHKCGLLTKAEAPVLSRYCVMFALWRDCAEFTMARGTAFPLRAKPTPAVPAKAPDQPGQEEKPGKVVGFRSYPQARFLNTYASQLLALERELGLTPSARARLEVDLPRWDDDAEDPAADDDGDEAYWAAG